MSPAETDETDETTTTRFGVRPDEWRVAGAIVAGFLILRAIAVRSTALVYFDSGDYRHVDLLGGGRRPFVVPLLYWFMPSDGWRVVEQAVISAAAWLVLALVVMAELDDRRVRLGALTTILAVGLTTQITNWDSAILSDSLAISFTVLLIAAWLHFRRHHTVDALVGVLAATVLWTFTRELHVYFTVAAAVIAVVVAVGRARTERVVGVLAAGLLVIAVVGVVEDRRNQDTSIENIAGVIGLRIMPDEPARAWFVDNGMPDVPELPHRQSIPRETLQRIPAFEHWLETKGLTTYAKYLLLHPNVAITGPYGELFEERQTYAEQPSTRPVMLSPAEAYGRARPVLPPVVESVLFDPGRTGAILTLTAAALIGAVVVRLRGRRDERTRAPLVVIGLVLPYVFLVWNGSVFEPGRHAMPGAVALRVGVVALLAVLADGWVAEREPTVRGPG
jgi:hypothetical protein